jgi:hypothetical protein
VFTKYNVSWAVLPAVSDNSMLQLVAFHTDGHIAIDFVMKLELKLIKVYRTDWNQSTGFKRLQKLSAFIIVYF